MVNKVDSLARVSDLESTSKLAKYCDSKYSNSVNIATMSDPIHTLLYLSQQVEAWRTFVQDTEINVHVKADVGVICEGTKDEQLNAFWYLCNTHQTHGHRPHSCSQCILCGGRRQRRSASHHMLPHLKSKHRRKSEETTDVSEGTPKPGQTVTLDGQWMRRCRNNRTSNERTSNAKSRSGRSVKRKREERF